MKVFDKWDMGEVKVTDAGLERYICLQPVIVPKTGGRNSTKRAAKWKINIVERLITKLMVPGHRSKKHVISSGHATGKFEKHFYTVRESMKIIEERTKKNPVEVLVRAIENSAFREEIAGYQMGGIIVRRSVVTSPQRRVDISLRSITQSAYRKSFGKKESIAMALAKEIIAASENDASNSEAVKEKERVEREAEGAR